MTNIYEPSIKIDYSRGTLTGEGVTEAFRRLGDLSGVFEDVERFEEMDENMLVYRVESHLKEEEGKAGGLFFGTSYVSPGTVGDEYFMTKGHFHSKRDTAEYYWCISGEGMLIQMDEQRNCFAEKMFPGSLHYIKGNIAHRIANTGNTVLAVGACWPSDAGHDYAAIQEEGFSARLKNCKGVPTLIPVK